MIRWTLEAQADLAGQVAWLHERSPAVAERVAEGVLHAVGRLDAFPCIGRAGRASGTRELATAPLPYVVVYQVREADVVILRVLHGAQLWLTKGDA